MHLKCTGVDMEKRALLQLQVLDNTKIINSLLREARALVL